MSESSDEYTNNRLLHARHLVDMNTQLVSSQCDYESDYNFAKFDADVEVEFSTFAVLGDQREDEDEEGEDSLDFIRFLFE